MLPVELAPLGGGGGGGWRSKAAFEIEMSLVNGTALHGPCRRANAAKPAEAVSPWTDGSAASAIVFSTCLLWCPPFPTLSTGSLLQRKREKDAAVCFGHRGYE